MYVYVYVCIYISIHAYKLCELTISPRPKMPMSWSFCSMYIHFVCDHTHRS